MIYSPPEADIVRVMEQTGMDRLQAIYHLQGRRKVQEMLQQQANRFPWGKAASLE